MFLLPSLISWLTGFLLLEFLLRKSPARIIFSLRLVLAFGLGLGISSYLTFLSFPLFDKLNGPFVIGTHGLTLIALIGLNFSLIKNIPQRLRAFKITAQNILELVFWGALIFLLGQYAKFYPDGGWDAWSVWNLKARFLYLGGHDWVRIFDPTLWRSSPHYPLFLPLLNVWGWIFTKDPTTLAPLWHSILITLLTLGALFYGLKNFVSSRAAWLGTLLLLSPPIFPIFGISQYSDIILGYYLLMIFIVLLLTKEANEKNLLLLGGLFTGFLTFIKPEGAIISLMLIFLSASHWMNQVDPKSLKTYWLRLGTGYLLGILPTVIFTRWYAPANITFINGLTSTTSPADGERLKIIFQFLANELLSGHWHGLWVVLLLGVFLGYKQANPGKNLIIPIFLLGYMLVICSYYWFNTYFEIRWWLNQTLSRLLISLLPTVIWWVFYRMETSVRSS